MKRFENKDILYGSIVVGVIVSIMIYFAVCCYGSTISGDEYFSIGFANEADDFLFLTLGAIDEHGHEGWLDGAFLWDWLTVQEGERFAFLPIHRNVRADVHPPLYFMLLNAMCSFFPERLCTNIGFALNLIMVLGIVVMMFLISKALLKNRWLALVPCIMFAISSGAATLSTYIRMYPMLGFLILLLIYLNIRIIQQKRMDKIIWLLLAGCVFTGSLTHYYFYLALGMSCIAMMVYLLKEKVGLKAIVQYIAAIAVPEMASILLWPYVFRHLLFSNRGMAALENLSGIVGTESLETVKAFLRTVNHNVYNGSFGKYVLAFCLLVLAAVVIYFINKKGNKELPAGELFESRGNIAGIYLGAVTVGYWLILMKVSYSAAWLYISPIFSLLCIITVYVLAAILSKISYRYYGSILLVVFAVLFYKDLPEKINDSVRSHDAIQGHHQLMLEYKGKDVLFFYKEWNNLYDNQILELMYMDEIYAVDLEDKDTTDYCEILEHRNSRDDIIVYYPNGNGDTEKEVQLIAKELNAEVSLITQTEFDIYRLKLAE